MNIHSLAKSARLYARAEALVAEIRLRIFARKMMLSVLATGVALLGLVMVNVALFNYLSAIWGPVWTPLMLGVANLVLAALLLLIATSLKPGPEFAMAEDLRKASSAAFEAEFRTGQGLVAELAGLGGGSSTAQLLIPTLSLIIGALRRKKPAAS